MTIFYTVTYCTCLIKISSIKTKRPTEISERRGDRLRGGAAYGHVVTVMHSKFDVGSRCDKGQVNDKAPLLAVELARWVFASTQFAELEARAEPAFPAGNNNPTVVCCHGISTKMLFLSRSSQQKEVAYETVDLTLCFCYLL